MFPYLVSAEQHALWEVGKVGRGALDVDGKGQLSVSLERRQILHVVAPNNLALVAVQTKQLQNTINMSSIIDVAGLNANSKWYWPRKTSNTEDLLVQQKFYWSYKFFFNIKRKNIA